jgi:hypothetical protein
MNLRDVTLGGIKAALAWKRAGLARPLIARVATAWPTLHKRYIDPLGGVPIDLGDLLGLYSKPGGHLANPCPLGSFVENDQVKDLLVMVGLSKQGVFWGRSKGNFLENFKVDP